MADPQARNTEALERHVRGDEGAAALLLPQIYDRLRALAGEYMKGERPGHTLQPTALVHDAYLRLIRIDRIDWTGKNHFFAMAAREMRRVLVDHARRRDAGKRGAGLRRVTLADDVAVAQERVVDVLALDQALGRLAESHPRRATVAELRIFAGMQIAEVAAALGISDRLAKEEWRIARAQIGRDLHSRGTEV